MCQGIFSDDVRKYYKQNETEARAREIKKSI